MILAPASTTPASTLSARSATTYASSKPSATESPCNPPPERRTDRLLGPGSAALRRVLPPACSPSIFGLARLVELGVGRRVGRRLGPRLEGPEGDRVVQGLGRRDGVLPGDTVGTRQHASRARFEGDLGHLACAPGVRPFCRGPGRHGLLGPVRSSGPAVTAGRPRSPAPRGPRRGSAGRSAPGPRPPGRPRPGREPPAAAATCKPSLFGGSCVPPRKEANQTTLGAYPPVRSGRRPGQEGAERPAAWRSRQAAARSASRQSRVSIASSRSRPGAPRGPGCAGHRVGPLTGAVLAGVEEPLASRTLRTACSGYAGAASP